MNNLLLLFIFLPLFAIVFSFSKVPTIRLQINVLSASLALGFILSCFFSFSYFQITNPITWEFSVIEINNISYNLAFSFGKYASYFIPLIFFISFIVVLYAQVYLKTEPQANRFFVLLSVFIAAMSGLILSNQWVLFLMFWEIVGICSFLLIGFWREKNAAADSSLKAILYNKIGDLGLWAFVLYMCTHNNMRISDVNVLIPDYIAYFALLAATLKSAQMPFSGWLVSAMTAPTPASALIHAATMVAAGIYFMVQISPLVSEEVLTVMRYVGISTAILGAISAFQKNDMKAALASSTASQLGFMLFAIGLGNAWAGFFHLFTHALFKSGLFLSAGVLGKIYENEKEPLNILTMGNLWQKNRVLTIFISLFLASMLGLPFTSGFFSKENILVSVLFLEGENYNLTLFLCLFSLFLTALYSVRIWLFIGFGKITKSTSILPNQYLRNLLVPLVFFSTWVSYGFLPWGNLFGFWAQNSASSHFEIVFLSVGINFLGGSLAYFLFRKYPVAISNFLPFHNPIFIADFLILAFAKKSLQIIEFYCKHDFKSLLFTYYSHKFSHVVYEVFFAERRIGFSTIIVRIAQKVARFDYFWDMTKVVIFELAFVFSYLMATFDSLIIDGLVRMIYKFVGYIGLKIKKAQGRELVFYLGFVLGFLILILLFVFIKNICAKM